MWYPRRFASGAKEAGGLAIFTLNTRARGAALALLGLAACRNFGSAPAPRAAQAAQPPQLTAATPAAAFSGQTVELTGDHFGAELYQNAVSIGGVPAEVLNLQPGSPATLTIQVPDLGPGPRALPLTLTVGGLTGSLSSPFGYRGAGHLGSLEVQVASDLSPRPRHMHTRAGNFALGQDRNAAYRVVMSDGSGEWKAPAGAYMGAVEFPTDTTVYLESVYPAPSYDFIDYVRVDDLGADGFQLTSWQIPRNYQGQYAPSQDGLLYLGPDFPTASVPWIYFEVGAPGIVRGATAQTGVDRFATVRGAGPATVAWVDVASGEAVDAGSFAAPIIQNAADVEALALTSDLGNLVVLVGSDGGGQEIVRVGMDADAGNASVVVTGLQNVSLLASTKNCALASRLDPAAVVFFSLDGTTNCGSQLNTSGIVRDLQRDEIWSDVGTLVGSPPQLFQVSPSSTPGAPVALNAKLIDFQVNPSETLAAASTLTPAAVAVLPVPALQAGEDDAFQSPGQVHQPKTTTATHLTWASDDILCARLTDTTTAKVSCGPASDLYGTKSCTQGFPALDRSKVSWMRRKLGGGLAVVSGSSASECAATACPASCAPLWFDGKLAADWVDLDASEDLGVIAWSSSAYTDLHPNLELLLQGQDSPQEVALPIPYLSAVVVDPTGQLVVAAGAGGTGAVIRAQDGSLAAMLELEGDSANTATFSPDGQRLYVGTVLVGLFEYDLTQLQGATAPDGGAPTLLPIRSALTGFPVDAIRISPGGGTGYLYSSAVTRDVIWRVQ